MAGNRKRGEKHMTVVEFARLTGVNRKTLMLRLEMGISLLAAAFAPYERKKYTAKHGHARSGSHSATYNSWQSMTQRCTNPSHKNFDGYGGRGIGICERWGSFELFLADMGDRPEGMTLDRLDVNGNYEAGNCQWSTPSEQSANRRCALVYEHEGRRLTLKEWSSHLGINYHTLRYRIRVYGWSIGRSLSTPILIDRSSKNAR
jgi:hypothetical protein